MSGRGNSLKAEEKPCKKDGVPNVNLAVSDRVIREEGLLVMNCKQETKQMHHSKSWVKNVLD